MFSWIIRLYSVCERHDRIDDISVGLHERPPRIVPTFASLSHRQLNVVGCNSFERKFLRFTVDKVEVTTYDQLTDRGALDASLAAFAITHKPRQAAPDLCERWIRSWRMPLHCLDHRTKAVLGLERLLLPIREPSTASASSDVFAQPSG